MLTFRQTVGDASDCLQEHRACDLPSHRARTTNQIIAKRHCRSSRKRGTPRSNSSRTVRLHESEESIETDCAFVGAQKRSLSRRRAQRKLLRASRCCASVKPAWISRRKSKQIFLSCSNAGFSRGPRRTTGLKRRWLYCRRGSSRCRWLHRR